MNDFAAICRQLTSLSEDDIATLLPIHHSLQLIADLTNCDVFIDCFDRDQRNALVIAHAKPGSGRSLYSKSALGMAALRDNEPAVYHALESGLPMRDLKAVTQEERSVKQDVAPVHNAAGQTIAVLIREKDISLTLRWERKMDQLARQPEDSGQAALLFPEAALDSLSVREINHRVKNDLQLIASIFNLQARTLGNEEHKRLFADNASRVLSIASVCDIISGGAEINTIDLKELLLHIVADTKNIIVGYYRVNIELSGDTIQIPADRASSIALVVNELVTNAIHHACQQGGGDTIIISIHPGQLYSSISVEDNGPGFDPQRLDSERLGLSLVFLTVRDKLRGEVHIASSDAGTSVSFDFRHSL